MNILLLLLINLDIGGYVDNRPFVGFTDSVIFTGFARGWIDMKADQDLYGANAALDLVLPYDSMPGMQRDGIEVPRLAAWIGPYNLRATMGRQLVNWGVSRVFKCLDFFNRVDYFEPEYEREGVDAIQALWAFSQRGSARLLCKPSWTIDNTLLAGRLASNFFYNDVGLNAFYQNEPDLIAAGIDIAGELLAGYWAETAYWQNDTTEFFKSTIGIDYTFPLSIYTMAEYFHDASGHSDPAQYDYGLLYNGTRSTLGQDYLYLSAGIVPNMYLRPAFNVIVNLDDQGTILIPNVFYAPFDNVDLNVGASFVIGDDVSEFQNIDPYSAVVYSWLKVYF
jgi:hypothetical protein